jgi:hypothetical protein
VPQPQFSGTPITCKFGGLALPNGQGTLSQINLNDLASWYLQDFQADLAKQISKGQFLWRAKGTILGRDFAGFPIVLPFRYKEASNGAFGAVLAQLSQAGEQQLTFDNNTYILAEFETTNGRKLLTHFQPYWYDLSIQFWCKTPWFVDVSATTISTVNVVYAPLAAPVGATAAGGALATGTYTLQYTYVTASGETAASPASGNIVLTSGNQQISVSAVTPLPGFATAVKWYFASGPTTGFTVQNAGGAFTLNTAGSGTLAPTSTPATQFSITYAGSVFAEPVFTLTVPSSNTGTITGATLINTMSTETLTVSFPGGLAVSTAYTITIDCGAFTVADAGGRAYDVAGSFPQLYPPVGQVNTMTVSATTSAGVASGLTLGCTYSNRWTI